MDVTNNSKKYIFYSLYNVFLLILFLLCAFAIELKTYFDSKLVLSCGLWSYNNTDDIWILSNLGISVSVLMGISVCILCVCLFRKDLRSYIKDYICLNILILIFGALVISSRPSGLTGALNLGWIFHIIPGSQGVFNYSIAGIFMITFSVFIGIIFLLTIILQVKEKTYKEVVSAIFKKIPKVGVSNLFKLNYDEKKILIRWAYCILLLVIFLLCAFSIEKRLVYYNSIVDGDGNANIGLWDISTSPYLNAIGISVSVLMGISSVCILCACLFRKDLRSYIKDYICLNILILIFGALVISSRPSGLTGAYYGWIFILGRDMSSWHYSLAGIFMIIFSVFIGIVFLLTIILQAKNTSLINICLKPLKKRVKLAK